MTSKASEVYNVRVHSFTPGAFKGILFLSCEKMVEEDGGANFGSELSAHANSWKERFSGEDPRFIYTIPGRELAPRITAPKTIRGKSTGVEIGDWSEIWNVIEAAAK